MKKLKFFQACENAQTMKKVDKIGQLDLKGMAVKYVFAFLFVVIVVVALSQIGIIGRITPGGIIETEDSGHITGATVGTEVQEEAVEEQIGTNETEATEVEENT